MKIPAIVSNRLHRDRSRSVIPSTLIVIVASVYIFFYYTPSYAFSWTTTRSVQAQEVYSDNIALAPSGSPKGAFVESISPTISLTGQSGLSTMSLNYRMQNIYNSGGNNSLSIYNQLQSSSHNTFIPNKLFLDSTSSISQQYINNNQIGADNINGANNSTNVYTFGLSPYWTPRFDNLANGSFRLNANTTAIGANASSTSNSNLAPISNSFNLAETMSLTSGAYFQRVKWNLGFNKNENYVANGQNVSYQNSNARISVPINAYFNVFVQGGNSNNSYQSTSGATNGGSYYTAGGQWTPSQFFSLTVGAGNNSYVTVFISPMPRLTWTTTYSDNSVGTSFGQSSVGSSDNSVGTSVGQSSVGSSVGTSGLTPGVNGSGNSGQNWQTALRYQAPRSTWTLSHNNSTTTSQQILAANQIFSNQQVNTLTNPGPNQFITNNPILTNDVIVTKTWNASVTFNTGRSTFSVNAFDSDYTYQTGFGNDQKVIGVTGSWNWPFASKTSAYLRPQWQKTTSQGLGTATNSQYYTVAIGLTQSITSQLNGTLDLRHMSQTSDVTNVSANNLLPTNGYQENRATATLSMRF